MVLKMWYVVTSTYAEEDGEDLCVAAADRAQTDRQSRMILKYELQYTQQLIVVGEVFL